MVANPIRMSQTPIRYTSAPPTLGQHTREVLREYGVGDEEFARLKTLNVV